MTSTISWNAYPALVAAGCFAAGICVHAWLDPPFIFWIIVAALALAAAAFSLRSDRIVGLGDIALTTAALLVVAAAGGLRVHDVETLPADHIARSGFDREVEVFGWIIDAPRMNGGSATFTLRLSDARRGPGPRTNDYTGLLLVTVRDAQHTFQTCDFLQIRGDLSELPRPRNPGDFDYGAYLRRHRIHARVFAAAVRPIGRRSTGITCAAADARAAIERRIDRYLLDDQARGVLRALLLGDRRAIDRDIRDQFARTGLLHVLAVSGLHVMVVGMILYRLLGPILMRIGLTWRSVELVRTTATCALLLAYMVLAGGSASVVRAVVMAILFMAAAAMQRSTSSMNTLGLAALVLLAIRPVHLFEPGFQLSMSAVAAIITLLPQLQLWMPEPRIKPARYVHASVLVTIAATLGTLPVLVAHFGQAALAGLLLNLPAIPITTGVLVSGITALAFGEISATFGVTVGASADVLARSLIAVSTWGDRHFGWSLISWSIDHPAPLLSLTLLVAAIARWRSPHHRWPLVIAALAVITLHSWVEIANRKWVPSLEILFLDVGQGDAAIVRLPDGEAMLIDAGPRTAYVDAGERVILPQLERLGIRRLLAALITHPDSDHLGGLPAVLRAVPIDRVIRSGFVHNSDLYGETNRLLDSLKVPQRTVVAGDTLQLGDRVRAYVLHPESGPVAGSPNDHSIVVRLVYGSTSFLLTGDAPIAAEYRMLSRYGELLESSVLKVGHHGSRTSSAPAFVSGVYAGEASRAVVSVAARNRFGLPDEDVMDRLRRTGFLVSSTADSGALWLQSDGHRIRETAY